MKGKILLEWPVAEESASDFLPYTKYRLVGVEPCHGEFEHHVEALGEDSMGEPAWVDVDKIDMDSGITDIGQAFSDLAWHLYKTQKKEKKK